MAGLLKAITIGDKLVLANAINSSGGTDLGKLITAYVEWVQLALMAIMAMAIMAILSLT